MKRAASIALVCLTGAILGAGEASAQLVPTGASIRFFEEGAGALTPIARRMYSTHFAAARTRYIGVEVHLAHAAPGVIANYGVTCQYVKPDGGTIGPIEIPFQVQPDSISSTRAGGRGWDKPGQWAPGTYRAQCSGGGRSLAEATFQVTSTPPDVPGVDVRVAEIRLFPSGAGAQVTALADRQYTTVFPAAQTTRIGVELQFAHAPLGRAISIPIDCYYFVPDGTTMGPVNLTYAPPPDWNGGYMASGWGWDQPGQWPRGRYTAVCMIHGRPVAVERFEVN